MNRKRGLKLFTPVQLGSLKLKHRVVMAPLTRSRSEQPGGIPGDKMVRYYSDRASDGGLIIGEATSISPTRAAGMVRPASIPISKSRDGSAL
jgi:N-ethylmaleimide reductase